MCENTLVKTIHGFHHGWDNLFEPIINVSPGTTIELICKDSGNGYFTPDSRAESVLDMPFDKVNPVTGPVFVEGAEPGDILKITIDSFQPSGFGWTANIPGFGLLADQFKQPALTLWNYDTTSMTPAMFGDFAQVPLKPFAGTIGLALAESGLHSVIPPRRVGGNLDIRDLNAGSTLYLPVEVAGALLSIGDTHAAQGDGEICGTAIESAMDITVTVDLIKNTPLHMPRFTTAGPVTRHLDQAGYEVFTGVGAELMQAARDAVSGAVEWVATQFAMPVEQAYMLCSVCGDLRINEIVDMPHSVVSFYVPKVVFG